MNRFYSLVFIFFVFHPSPYGQQIKKLPEFERLYRYAEKLYTSPSATEASDSIALSTFQKVIGILNKEKKYNATLVDSYLKSAIIQMPGNKQEQALASFRKAIATISHGNNLADSLYFQPYLYLGTIHYNLNDLDSALYYFNRAEAINNKYTRLNESERLYNKAGALYYETGDYKKSITYFEKALSLVEEAKPLNVFFMVNYKNNIATALLKSGEYKKALEIFTAILPYHIAEDELCYNIGNAYIEEGNFKNAIKFLKRIRQMQPEKFNGLAKVFIQLKQYDSAQLYLSKARQAFLDKKSKARNINYGLTLKYAGDLDAATRNTFKAIKNYQLAINYLYPVFSDTNINNNPASFSGLQNFNLLFDVLVAKAASFNQLDKDNPNQHYLEQSLSAYTSALTLANHIERTYFSDDARLFLKHKVSPATQQAVDVAIRLFNLSKGAGNYLNIAFGFVENNKASVLQAGLQNLELSQIPGIPVELVTAEKKYKVLITKLSLEIARAKDSLTFSVIQKKIQDNEIALAAVQQKLDNNVVYHQLKFTASLTSIESIQHQKIGKDEAALSYFYTLNNLFCFYITKEVAGISSIPLKDNLFSTITLLRKELENPQASGRKSLEEAGSLLFDDLFLPVLEKVKDKKRLVIIPYNEISYVPFEMMQDKDGTLLLKRFAISYNYSVNFFTDKISRKENSYQVLAMAPFSEDGKNRDMPSLPSSGDEINNLPGKKLNGKAATKQAFETWSGRFPIIHLATHAVANDADPLRSFIEFYGLQKDTGQVHRLYETEIYNLDMKSARLLILSACETGNGLLVNGEGVMSLSRAFSYAGCKSVVTSLWKADDIATAFIVKRLHHYLQKGMLIDDALQYAKIDYLNNSDIEDRYKSPAYWAHLVLIGEHQSLVAAGFQWYWMLAIIFLAAIFFTFYLKMKSRP